MNNPYDISTLTALVSAKITEAERVLKSLEKGNGSDINARKIERVCDIKDFMEMTLCKAIEGTATETEIARLINLID